MALYSLYCAEVPLRNCSLTHSLSNKLHSIKPTLGYVSYSHLGRRDAVTLRRLRIGHTRFSHSCLLNREDQPRCTYCDCALTVVHTLLECPHYSIVRQQACTHWVMHKGKKEVTGVRYYTCLQTAWFTFNIGIPTSLLNWLTDWPVKYWVGGVAMATLCSFILKCCGSTNIISSSLFRLLTSLVVFLVQHSIQYVLKIQIAWYLLSSKLL